MQKVIPAKTIPNKSGTKYAKASTLQKAIDDIGAKRERIADLQAEIKIIQSELSGSDSEMLVDEALDEVAADKEVIIKGVDYRLEASAKRAVSAVDATGLTKALIEAEQFELLAQIASYKQTDLKKYVDNWEAFVTSEKTGSRTVKFGSITNG